MTNSFTPRPSQQRILEYTGGRLVSGLLHRYRERIYICISEFGESGFEGRGELLRAFQKVL